MPLDIGSALGEFVFLQTSGNWDKDCLDAGTALGRHTSGGVLWLSAGECFVKTWP